VFARERDGEKREGEEEGGEGGKKAGALKISPNADSIIFSPLSLSSHPLTNTEDTKTCEDYSGILWLKLREKERD
jgi:hypothetical protein